MIIAVFDYSPLWKTLEEKQVSQYQLIKMGIDYKTMDTLRNNRNTTARTISKICLILDCTPNDVLKITKESE